MRAGTHDVLLSTAPVESMPTAADAKPSALLDATGFLDSQDVGGSRRSVLLNPYYTIKPMLPRTVRLVLRRAFARYQARRSFPAWPIETLRVDELKDRFRAELNATGSDRIAFLNFWPERRRFALIVTHDVEGSAGVENIPRVLELERRYGLRSSWNFVAEDYAIDAGVFSALRTAGCEIGLHGLHHDGLLFADRASFLAQVPRIREVMREWDAVGFRSPATHRQPAWMAELGCLYDSSFPDTDPFEPQPDGCCSIWPFFLGEMVELPITMPQDHTLFEVLKERTIRRWVEKADWLAANHGLVNVLVHPDYLLDDRRLELYEQLLAHLTGLSGAWHVLPRDVASWWRLRSRLQHADAPSLSTADAPERGPRATTAYARKEGEQIVFDI
jgi:peptidoglycan/xylan/chitin deacetylase (PgdA/CDA1 family)